MERETAADELAEAEMIATDVRSVIAADPTGIHPFRSDDLAVLLAEYDERGRELERLRGADLVTKVVTYRQQRDDARAEVERLRRALAGHLFDGESLSTREALRSELVEQGLKDSAELERLHTWAGLMSLLDEHYPADVMTGESGDPGPRIVALVRELDRLRAILGEDA